MLLACSVETLVLEAALARSVAVLWAETASVEVEVKVEVETALE